MAPPIPREIFNARMAVPLNRVARAHPSKHSTPGISIAVLQLVVLASRKELIISSAVECACRGGYASEDRQGDESGKDDPHDRSPCFCASTRRRCSASPL